MNKLPAFQTIKHALKAVFQFRNAGTRIGLPWILVLTVISFFGRSFSTPPDPSESGINLIILSPVEIVIAALSIIIFSSIAVNWHRYILLDEITAPEKIFRLDRPVWNYAGRTISIMLISFAPILILLKLFGTVPVLGLLLIVAAVFVAGIYVIRMSVALPAMALERRDFGIVAALQSTRGNNLQFAAVFALNSLILLAAIVAQFIVLSLVGAFSLTAARFLSLLLNIPVALFLSLFSVSLLSSLYGFFVEKRKF